MSVRWRSSWKGLSLIVFIVAMDVAVSAVVWRYSSLGLPEWSRDCENHSAVVIFFGGQNVHTIARLQAAHKALLECPKMSALLVGGSRPGRSFWGSEWMRFYLVEKGISPTRLATELRSYDSRGNVTEMYALARKKDLRHLILVSDPLHLHRLLYIVHHSQFATIAIKTISTYPRDDRTAFLWRPHYEAMAWMAQILPESMFHRLLRMFRS